MPTTVSTTALTPAEIQLLGECSAHGLCASISKDIAALQARISTLQARKAAADAALQSVYKTVLSSKSPAVPVASDAKVVRRVVDGVDSLLVQTP